MCKCKITSTLGRWTSAAVHCNARPHKPPWDLSRYFPSTPSIHSTQNGNAARSGEQSFPSILPGNTHRLKWRKQSIKHPTTECSTVGYQFCGLITRRIIYTTINNSGASLVLQWVRVHLPMQGTRVRPLVQEDPTCHRATEPVHDNGWACVLEPAGNSCEAHTPGACALQEKPPQWEALTSQGRAAPTHCDYRKPTSSNQDPAEPKRKGKKSRNTAQSSSTQSVIPRSTTWASPGTPLERQNCQPS